MDTTRQALEKAQRDAIINEAYAEAESKYPYRDTHHAKREIVDEKRDAYASALISERIRAALTSLRSEGPETQVPPPQGLVSDAPAPHQWDQSGERCTVCGSKDWMPGGCIPGAQPSPAGPTFVDPGRPVIRIGRYTISEMSETSVWIRDEKAGDAGQFSKEAIAVVIGEFYKHNL